MRVLIYSPVRLFGEGISAFLGTLEKIDAVLVEHDAAELETKAPDFDADVALVDVTMPNVLLVARSIRALCPGAAMIAMAVTEVADDVIACADAGFTAYLPRNASVATMIATVDLAFHGETVCAPQITRSLFDELSRRPTASQPVADECLTPREAEMARMLARGLSNKEIARELQLSIATVKNHVHSVLHKLQIVSRSQVAALLLSNPWVLRFPHGGSASQRVDT